MPATIGPMGKLPWGNSAKTYFLPFPSSSSNRKEYLLSEISSVGMIHLHDCAQAGQVRKLGQRDMGCTQSLIPAVQRMQACSPSEAHLKAWPSSAAHLKYSLQVLNTHNLLNQGHSTGLAGSARVESRAMTMYSAARLKKAATHSSRKKFIHPTAEQRQDC